MPEGAAIGAATGAAIVESRGPEGGDAPDVDDVDDEDGGPDNEDSEGFEATPPAEAAPVQADVAASPVEVIRSEELPVYTAPVEAPAEAPVEAPAAAPADPQPEPQAAELPDSSRPPEPFGD